MKSIRYSPILLVILGLIVIVSGIFIWSHWSDYMGLKYADTSLSIDEDMAPVSVEVFPHIDSVTPNPALSKGQVILNGDGFAASGNTVTLNSKTSIYTFTRIASSTDGGKTMRFTPNVPAGDYYVQVTDPKTGASNRISLKVTGSATSASGASSDGTPDTVTDPDFYPYTPYPSPWSTTPPPNTTTSANPPVSGNSSGNVSGSASTPASTVPVIFSMSPVSGPPGTTITINGKNFVPLHTYVHWYEANGETFQIYRINVISSTALSFPAPSTPEDAYSVSVEVVQDLSGYGSGEISNEVNYQLTHAAN